MFLEHQISILLISERSCDTEDWSNGLIFSFVVTGINYILNYIKIKKLFFLIVIILLYLLYFCHNK